MKSRTYLIALLFCAGSAASAIAQPNAEFAKANQEYAQGNFKEAVAGYDSERDHSGSGDDVLVLLREPLASPNRQ